MYFHGYVLVTLDEKVADKPSKAARRKIRANLRRLNRRWHGIQPARQFQARQSLDGRKAIYEIAVDDLSATMAKAVDVMPELAKDIDYRFFGYGRSWQESRKEVLAYLAEHADEWEPKAWRNHLTT